MSAIKQLIETLWYEKPWYAFIWLGLTSPLRLFFVALSNKIRRRDETQQLPFSVPVIVVGNISVGGTGKTPLVISLVEHLQAQGLKVGVVSRGYGASDKPLKHYPLEVNAQSTGAQVGDEPLLNFWRTGAFVVVDPNRHRAVEHCITQGKVDVVIADDGMQHYRLYRDIEIAVIDAKRGLGNGRCLPSGPLREAPARLNTVDFVIENHAFLSPDAIKAMGSTSYAKNKNVHSSTMTFQAQAVKALAFTQEPWRDDITQLHAVAGIGDPQRFFNTAQAYCANSLITHGFKDHHNYAENELIFSDDVPVLMTEKDAVKCMTFKALKQHYYLPIQAQLSESFWQSLDAKLKPLLNASSTD